MFLVGPPTSEVVEPTLRGTPSYLPGGIAYCGEELEAAAADTCLKRSRNCP